MSTVSYGSYTLPEPSPFVAIDDNPIYMEGSLDHLSKKITLIGKITGENLLKIHTTKQKLISGFLSEYQNLTIDSESFNFVKPVSISFQESNLSRILPYSIELEAYEYTSFSNYYGIKDPVNTWSYSEQDGRIVNVTNTISAVGLKVDSSTAIDQAINFVSSSLDSFKDYSFFHSGQNAFLRSQIEQYDRFRGFYSLTRNWKLDVSKNPISNNAIISPKVQISYSKGDSVKISVNGDIIGSVNGEEVSENLFDSNKAKEFALNALIKSKSNFENNIYDAISRGPSSYNYTHNQASNTISFSFEFTNATDTRNEDVLNNYTVSISATKDSNLITVSVNGELKYNGPNDIYTGGSLESSARFAKLQQRISTINPYQLALEHFSSFISLSNNQYESSSYLNNKAIAENINKNPFETKISYSYSYNNNIDPSNGQLNDCEVSISDTRPVAVTMFKNGMNGLVNQLVANRMLGELSVTATANNLESSLPTLKNIAKQYLNKNCKIINETSTVGQSEISYTITSNY
jgi:hypothetical protein